MNTPTGADRPRCRMTRFWTWDGSPVSKVPLLPTDPRELDVLRCNVARQGHVAFDQLKPASAHHAVRRCRRVLPSEDFDLAARILDQAGLLQSVRAQRHGGSPYPQHVRKKFLRQRNYIRLGHVLRLQEPTTKPRFDAVKSVARCRLLRLHQDCTLKFVDKSSEGQACLIHFQKFRPLDLQCRTRDLDRRLCG